MAVKTGMALTANGSRVALNGEGGDEFLGSFRAFHYAEQLRELDWRTLASSFHEDSAAFGSRETLRLFYRDGVRALAPATLRNMRRKIRGTLSSPANRQLLSSELRELIESRREKSGLGGASVVRDPARRALRMTLEGGFTTYVRDFVSRSCARQGYDVRSPMYARSLIEFAFAIPERQRRRADVNKYVHLGALAGDLPRSVLTRKRKASFNLAYVRQIDKAKSGMLSSMQDCRFDWLDADGLSKLLTEWEREPTGLKPVYPLWAVFGCLNLFK
jgi:asparagine synthetase B (glutamine-hydrolysing)